LLLQLLSDRISSTSTSLFSPFIVDSLWFVDDIYNEINESYTHSLTDCSIN
jgi:hypothetical protein